MRRVDVRIAVDQSIRTPLNRRACRWPTAPISRSSPLRRWGVRRALRVVAESRGLPCVVAAEVESSIDLRGWHWRGAAGCRTRQCARRARLLAGDIVSDARSLIVEDGYLPVAPMPPPLIPRG